MSNNGRRDLGTRSCAVALVAGALVALAGAMVAEPRDVDPGVSATLVGRLEPGGTGRLAVRWDGEPGALLDTWVDLDGDGFPASDELVVSGRPLAPGVEAVSFELPHDARVDSQPAVWVEVHAEGRRWTSRAAGLGAASEGRSACVWQPGFTGAPDFDGPVLAMTVFDDGSGPALYAGGTFYFVGRVFVCNIARWDGTAWSALSGPSGTGVGSSYDDDAVYSLAVFDDGSGPALYAGGTFDRAGCLTVNGIARWDGSAWSALSGPSATGMDYYGVSALVVFDDGTGAALYAGGGFDSAGGVTVNHIARWDGSGWSSLSGPSGTGVAGGSYLSVYALAVFDDGSGPALYAGGAFDTAGGVTVHDIARWDGSAWSALTGLFGTGFGEVCDLAVYDDGSGRALYVGGLGCAGGVSLCNIARWDGTDWSVLSGPSDAGMGGADPWVYALAVYDDGNGAALYAAGAFDTAGGVAAKCIARWDGGAWSPLRGPSGTGLAGFYADTRAYALAVYDDGSGPALYAGGFFVFAGGVESRYIARWDGSAWFALSGPSGTGMGGEEPVVHALAIYDDGSGPALYAGGEFSTAGGVTVTNIARWDGSAWSALSGPSGTGVDDTVYALAVFDEGTGPALYAGGGFDTAGGVTVSSIARWDGTGWSPLSGPSGTGVGGGSWHDVWDLAVFDDGSGPALYAGGEFVTAGGVTVNNIARWDGSAWSALSGPSGTGTDAWVETLAAFDHGLGPTLYAGGGFDTAGGLPSDDIAAWRCPFVIFVDGFESSDTSAWSLTVP